jgi:hypothetical protein
MIPHEAPHQAVDPIATKNHITGLNSAVCQADLHPVWKLLHILDD